MDIVGIIGMIFAGVEIQKFVMYRQMLRQHQWRILSIENNISYRPAAHHCLSRRPPSRHHLTNCRPHIVVPRTVLSCTASAPALTVY
jgi:hypothetical protein